MGLLKKSVEMNDEIIIIKVKKGINCLSNDDL